MPPSQTPLSTPSESHFGAVAFTALIVVLLVGGVVFAANYFGYIGFTTPTASSFADDQNQEIGQMGSPAMEEQQQNTATYPTHVRDGVYSLVGNAAAAENSYTGTVEIYRRDGSSNVYDLTWRIGSTQEQWGVGILRNGILSVGYYDQTGGVVRDAGVVSFVAETEGKLAGEWTSLQGGGTGREELQWLSQ